MCFKKLFLKYREKYLPRSDEQHLIFKSLLEHCQIIQSSKFYFCSGLPKRKKNILLSKSRNKIKLLSNISFSAFYIYLLVLIPVLPIIFWGFQQQFIFLNHFQKKNNKTIIGPEQPLSIKSLWSIVHSVLVYRIWWFLSTEWVLEWNI